MKKIQAQNVDSGDVIIASVQETGYDDHDYMACPDYINEKLITILSKKWNAGWLTLVTIELGNISVHPNDYYEVVSVFDKTQ